METTDHNNFSTSDMPIIRGTVTLCLRVRTLAEALPPVFHPFVASGKMSILVFIGGQALIFVLWLPFWLINLCVGELGFYLISIFTVFSVGRTIIRMIAFPGSSSRISKEIETEFAKYSVRIITSAADSIIDLAAAVQGFHVGSKCEIPALWKRVKSYRDRVLGVYFEVLYYTLQDGADNSSSSSSGLNKYGNNILKGDIGNLSTILAAAKEDGRTLLNQLENILMQIDKFEDHAKPILENSGGNPADSVREISNALMTAATELKNFVESLKPLTGVDASMLIDNNDSENFTVGQISNRLEEEQSNSGSLMKSIRMGFSSIIPMLDPPRGECLFGFDVLRGCLLSRYIGSRQVWVQRPDGGMVDCIHIPAKTTSSASSADNATVPLCNSKAVLYCNPNAGLIEVSTGMSLAGGNVSSDIDGVLNDNCWTDFYTNVGFDIYLFNYAGFGRSYGRGYLGMCESNNTKYLPGIWGRIKRICHSFFCSFTPTPDSLRADGLAVSKYIISQMGFESLIIHGESIGGIAASGTARKLTEDHHKDKIALLICDRTFCNLEAVAQRLVGGWSGKTIRMLTPFWSTDVVGDFLASRCAKVVANDAADAIIADCSSLKSGISLWKEIKRSSSSTKDLAWMIDAPLHYRMADWENVCVNDSRFVSPTRIGLTPPVWPADQHISKDEGFHFAACAKRIGKLASMEKKKYIVLMSSLTNDTEKGAHDSCQAPIYLVWRYLGCCEGLCGSPLGVTVKGGYDTTVAWLASLLTFGGQTVVEAIEHRKNWSDEQVVQAENSDFDCRPLGYETVENDSIVHPKPIPEVLKALERIIEDNPNDEILNSVTHEVSFVINTLQYVVSRLSTRAILETSWKSRHFDDNGLMAEGFFFNLNCGHNNPYSDGERKKLEEILLQVTRSPQMSAS